MGDQAEAAHRVQGTETAPLPNFLIIGAMRSGTTWLARCLGEHPSIYVPPEKELHYFDSHPDKGLDWYRQWFARTGGATAIGEATQKYIYDPAAVDWIAEVLPEARLIAILRNPIDRAHSHYWLNRAHGRESLDLADALDAECDRLKADRRSRFRYSYVDRGRYATQLRHVMERFPRSAVHVLLFEEFRRSPNREYDTVCDFLGVDRGFDAPTLAGSANGYQEFRSLKTRRAAQKLDRRGVSRVARTLLGRVNRRPSSYPRMPDAIRERLAATFKREVQELEQMLQRDLSLWDI